MKVLDGCALLWTVNWPKKKSIAAFIDNFWAKIQYILKDSNVHLVSDRYLNYSIKSATRQSRSIRRAGEYVLSNITAELPAQADVLTSSKNKMQLIEIICRELPQRAAQLSEIDAAFNNSLIITGAHDVPEETKMGIRIMRQDMITTHEEADVIMTSQAIGVALANIPVTVVSDDTDVFLLLLHFTHSNNIDTPVFMEATSGDRTVVDIIKTKVKHTSLCSRLLAAHALTGCDTVSKMYGIGKITALTKLAKGMQLNHLGNLESDMDDIIKQSSSFIASCYGRDPELPYDEARYAAWLAKTGNKKARKVPDLKTLPPTSEALQEHIKRAHIQVAIWKGSLFENPPILDPKDYGWTEDTYTKSLVPITLPDGVVRVPPQAQQLIKCGCASQEPCSTGRCSCVSARVSCTVFCACRSSDASCCNPSNTERETASDYDYEEGSIASDVSECVD